MPFLYSWRGAEVSFHPLLIGETQVLKARAYLLCDVSE
jgi:hypothetical protein